jgi:hypothetical protein
VLSFDGELGGGGSGHTCGLSFSPSTHNNVHKTIFNNLRYYTC